MPFTIQCASENVFYPKVIFVLYKEHSVLVFTSSEYCTKLEREYFALTSDILHTRYLQVGRFNSWLHKQFMALSEPKLQVIGLGKKNAAFVQK